MPVVSMSMRPLIGMVHALETPGSFTARSIASMSFSGVMPLRHCDSGLSATKVSIISMGAGSVALSELPALPKTLSTSGNDFRILSCFCRSACADVIESPGRVVGMKSSVPS